MKRPNVTLTVTKDVYTSDHTALFSSYALNKYSLIFEDIKISTNDKEKLIGDLLKANPNLITTTFNLNPFYDFTVLESDDELITFDSYDNKSKTQINFYFQNYKDAKPVYDIIHKYRDIDDEIFIFIDSFFFNSSKKIEVSTNKKVVKDFEKDNNMYYPYIDVDEMMNQYVKSNDNILLLSGIPGVGKTRLGDTYMKYLINKVKPEMSNEEVTKTIDLGDNEEVSSITEKPKGIKVAYIKDEDILADDVFWQRLQEEEYQLVFLDDLDYSLLPRKQAIDSSIDINKNKFISNLLSFTDGIFEAGSKTKFIITTNRMSKDIDKAVLRKGRTFDILELRPLHNNEALKIWLEEGLEEDSFYNKFGKGTVLQSDLGSYISLLKTYNKDEKEIKKYLLEDNISKYKNINNPKKIGL